MWISLAVVRAAAAAGPRSVTSHHHWWPVTLDGERLRRLPRPGSRPVDVAGDAEDPRRSRAVSTVSAVDDALGRAARPRASSAQRRRARCRAGAAMRHAERQHDQQPDHDGDDEEDPRPATGVCAACGPCGIERRLRALAAAAAAGGLRGASLRSPRAFGQGAGAGLGIGRRGFRRRFSLHVVVAPGATSCRTLPAHATHVGGDLPDLVLRDAAAEASACRSGGPAAMVATICSSSPP